MHNKFHTTPNQTQLNKFRPDHRPDWTHFETSQPLLSITCTCTTNSKPDPTHFTASQQLERKLLNILQAHAHAHQNLLSVISLQLTLPNRLTVSAAGYYQMRLSKSPRQGQRPTNQLKLKYERINWNTIVQNQKCTDMNTANIYKSKTEERLAYRFSNHGHLDRVVFYLCKCFLLALANHEQGVRMELSPSIIGRMRLVLK